MIRVGGWERATCYRGCSLDQLEFLAEFQALGLLQVDIEVGVSRIAIRTRATVRCKVYAVLASEAQFEARGFVTQTWIDQRTHGSLKRLRGLPALKEEMEIASHATRDLRGIVRVLDIDELARVREIRVERRVRQACLRRTLVRVTTEQ